MGKRFDATASLKKRQQEVFWELDSPALGVIELIPLCAASYRIHTVGGLLGLCRSLRETDVVMTEKSILLFVL